MLGSDMECTVFTKQHSVAISVTKLASSGINAQSTNDIKTNHLLGQLGGTKALVIAHNMRKPSED